MTVVPDVEFGVGSSGLPFFVGRDDRAMIEFKSDCGHTVRARDEDAGGVVRCSYCGRMAAVPETKGDELDFLFSDADGDAVASSPAARGKPPKRRKLFSRRAKKPTDFDPFAVVMKLCYAALLIIIVIFVGRTWIGPLFQDGGVASAITNPFGGGGSKKDAPPPKEAEDKPRPVLPGLIDRDRLGGLYVMSVPSGASVSCVLASMAPSTGRIDDVRGCKTFVADGHSEGFVDGTYVVEVSFWWNDPKLTVYGGFKQFRRTIMDIKEDRRDEKVRQYFLPDRATRVYADYVSGDYRLVRQYRDVVIKSKRSQGVRALFLPRLLGEDGKSFDIAALIRDGYIPSGQRYKFDENVVLGELDFYGVRPTDRDSVMEMLRRIGVVPFHLTDGTRRQFEIDLFDGKCSTPLID